jgi:YD repeat-containing protein
VTHSSFDTLGNLVKKTDGNGKTTQLGYKDNYLDTGCIGSTAATYAFPTSMADALGHTTTTAYYSCVGKPGWVQDSNDLAGNRYGATVSYDAAGRLHSTTTADGGGSTIDYPTPNEMDRATLVTATSSHSLTTMLDEFGRVASVTDNSSGSETDTFYDLVGNINCTSNPHFGEPSSTDGSTCYSYDALKRITATKYPDSSQTTYTWKGNSVTTTDPLGIRRMATTDALGRLTLVLEPNGASTMPSLSTSYTYDAQNNLLSVSQSGAATSSSIPRFRQFKYDGLSRLVSATNPETGTITYSYDGNGNVLTSTDARSVTTTYAYDAVNRVTSKTYNDSNGTPSSCFQYDGAAVVNGIGRLSRQWTQAGSCASSASGAWTQRSILAYDPMGRVASEQQATIASQSNEKYYTPQYTYDLAGDLTSSTDGITPTPITATAPPLCAPNTTSGVTLTVAYCYDAASRVQSLYSNWNDLAGHPAMLFSTPSYAPPGELVGATYGNGLNLSRTYDNRLRITNEIDTSSAVAASTNGTALVTVTGVEQYQ